MAGSNGATSAQVDSARSWLVTLAAVTSMFTVFGVGYSFGAFFESMSEEFDTSSGQTALVFSLTISLSFIFGLFTGRWADRVGPRPVLLTAAASLAAGLLLTSITPSIWIGYLTYGLGVGFAIACGYVPMVAAVGGWFEKQRATAMGVAVAGIGLGTLVGSPLAAYLINATSWRTAYVIMAIGGAGLLALASLVAERGPAAVESPVPRPLTELLRVRDFRQLYLSSMCATFGIFVPFVFVVTYAKEQGIDDVPAATLVGLIGAFSIVGRLGLSALAGAVGTMRLYIISFAGMACSHFIWLFAGGSYVALVIYTIVLGISYGGFIALSPTVVAERFGMDGLGGVIGMLYTSAAIGSLGGPPLAGFLKDQFGWKIAIAFGLVMSWFSVLTLLPLLRPNASVEPAFS